MFTYGMMLACVGDTLEVKTYERLLPLVPHDLALGSLRSVQRGDCVVAFSRKEVHAIKRAIDSYGHLRCCMVYGALPSEARKEQVSAPFVSRYAHNTTV